MSENNRIILLITIVILCDDKGNPVEKRIDSVSRILPGKLISLIRRYHTIIDHEEFRNPAIYGDILFNKLLVSVISGS